MKSALRQWIILIAILIASFLMYLPSISNNFIWDDHTIIEDNPVMRISNPSFFLGETYWPPIMTNLPPPYYRPMVIFCFWMEFKIFGSSPVMFRIFNLFLFFITTILVFYFAKKLFGSEGIALFSAAIFALNPIHTESVAFVSGMTDVSAAFFIMLAMLTFSSEKWWSKFLCAPVFFALSLFSKETATAGLLIFPAYEFFIRRRKFWSVTVSTLPFIIPVFVYFFLRHWVLGVFGGYQVQSLNILSRIIAIPYILVRYIQNIVFPFDLAPLHPQWYFDHSTVYWLLWVLPLAAIIWGIFAVVRNWKLKFGVFWAVIFLLPALRVGASHQGALWAERFAFLSTIGASIVIGFYFNKLFDLGTAKYKDVGKIAVFGYIIILFIFGFEYSFWWRNDWIGFRRIINDAPNQPVGYSGMAEQFLGIGETDSAYYYIREALERDSANPLVLTTAADIAIKMRKYDDALSYSKKLIDLHPSYTGAYIDAGISSIMLGDTNVALNYLKKAIEIAPLNPMANKIYSEMLLSLGDTVNALFYLRITEQLLPDDSTISRRYEKISSEFEE